MAFTPPAQPIPFTPQAYQQMQADFDALIKEREEVVVRLSIAREQGDLSENGAYKYAKMELGRIGREQKRLKYLLQFGKVVTANQSQTVNFGNTITLKNANGKELTFMLVSEYESNPAEQKLSTKSPFGEAVQGKKVSDVIQVLAPSGQQTFTIIRIE